jgi:hypothetical protein
MSAAIDVADALDHRLEAIREMLRRARKCRRGSDEIEALLAERMHCIARLKVIRGRLNWRRPPSTRKVGTWQRTVT